MRGSPESIERYFRREFYAASLNLAALVLFGEASREYTAAFLVSCLFVWPTMLALAWDALRPHPNPLACFAVGAGFAAFCGVPAVLERHSHFYDWVNIFDASMAVFCAIPCGIGAGVRNQRLGMMSRKVELTLMLSWLTLASFQFGFVAHVWQSSWMAWNDWMPTAVLAISCCYISKLSGGRERGVSVR